MTCTASRTARRRRADAPVRQAGRLMPPIQRGSAYKLGAGKWGLRYYDANGERRRKSPFPTKSAALQHYRHHVEPQLRGEPAARHDVTLSEFVPLYLERHAATVRPPTIA